MVVLIPGLVAVYLIGVFGLYLATARTEPGKAVLSQFPKLGPVCITIPSLLWPVSVMWFFIKEITK